MEQQQTLSANPQDIASRKVTNESELDISSFVISQFITKTDSESSESSDHFFEEDLVWPDPYNAFPKTSGIKPAVLTADLKHLNVGNLDSQPKTRCQMAMVVRKRPRPKSLPWNVVVIDSDPPFIEADDVEEYLVHDPLFVEFFNAFLALPSFPEAVCFNIESGGFEVATDGRLKLAQQIKEAVRSQNTKIDMYNVAHQHAFSDIPVVPIEDTEGPEQVKIERTFDVTALNKEQGIVWVKSARLPIFLESDYYFQYRLAKVISQASIFNERGEFVVMKIDYTTKPKTKKKTVEVQPPTQEELIVKEMYVSFGDLKGAAKEAWFTQAKRQLSAEPTFTSMGSGVSHSGGDSSLKTKKKSSVFNSHFFGVYSPGLIGPNETEPPIHDTNLQNNYSVSRERPFTPRPSDRIHAATSMLRAKLSKDPNASEEMIPTGNVVFVWPKQDLQNISDESDLEDKADREVEFARRMKEHQIIDQIYNDGSWEEGGTGNIILSSVNELGAVIVGAVMKKTISEMLGVDEKAVLSDPVISGIYPSADLTCVTVDKLSLCMVIESSKSREFLGPPTPMILEDLEDIESIPDRQPVHVKWSKTVLKPAGEDPDEESLLDSDEDFEDRDGHFRRNQIKWHSLTTMKGIQAFEKFITGTQGEKYWELWIDIDKGRLIRNEEEKQKYIMMMRDKYYKKGSQFELSAENKRKLKLENLSQWIPEHLLKIQAQVLEPLVLYWAPRYLLSHLIHTSPEKYYLYNELKSSSYKAMSDPNPHTRELLPLRPKSCCPNKSGHVNVENSNFNAEMQDMRTAPRVGNRRVYGQDTLQRLAKTPTAKYLKVGKKVKEGTHHLEEIRGDISTSLSSDKLPGHPRIISDAPTDHQVVEESPGHASQHQDVGGIQPSLTSFTSVVPADPLKKKHTTHPVKCPYKSLDAIFLGPKHLNRGLMKKQKELLLPEVKSAATKEDKCKGIKPKSIRRIEEDTNYTFFRQDSKDSYKSCEQYKSMLVDGQASLKEAELAELQECEFLFSERLEFLLRALHHEQDSGRAFRKYLEQSKRADWINDLDFWEKVQEYRKLFYKDKLDLHFITKNARSIFAQCIVEGAPQSISVSKQVRLFILDHLSPPHENLFDRAEEKALKVLFEAFRLYIYQDVKNYCEVERAVSQRRLETRNTYILDLQKQGIIKERPLTPDDPMEGYVDQVFDDSVLAKFPDKFKNYNMTTLAQDRLELEYFRQFLIPRCAEIDLKCWMDMESWRRTSPGNSSLRDTRAIDIKKNYLNKKYFFGPHSPAGKDGQNKVMEVGGGWGKFLEDKPHHNSILKAQKYVKNRLEQKHLPFFIMSKDFVDRHLIDPSNVEAEEDGHLFTINRSRELMKVINEGEQAFETITEIKRKQLELNARKKKDSVQSKSLSMSARSSAARLMQPAALPVLPPIAPDQNMEQTDIDSKQLEQRQASVDTSGVLSKRASSLKSSSRLMSAVQSTMSNSRFMPKARRGLQSRWQALVNQHGNLIAPMGLLENIVSIEAPTTRGMTLESKWISTAREIFLFKRALKNPNSCSQFKKFVSLSGGNLENDILFWLEVQRYKKMHHKHTEEALLQRKVNAIINCFISSFLTPSLQIDIPEEMANELVDHKQDTSPYVFREAQTSVFRHLLPHWAAFHEYHKNLGNDEKILQTLPRHRALAKAREQKYREQLAQIREEERLFRLQYPTHPGSTSSGEGKLSLEFTYSEFLAHKLSFESYLSRANLVTTGTQTVRSLDLSESDLSLDDLATVESTLELKRILDSNYEFNFRTQSSHNCLRKPLDALGTSQIRATKEKETRDSPQKTK